ncbi:acyltransferase [Sinirhodobacter populi]|uniref:Acyltransferase n=1 Tax=Paenirhodobacter populi TaxID=2306993 RepID=A0A443K6S5_9RHOB|nr:acyltransferase [Sinirhodobacter populi]RWR28445.1 acyltransferase [Sinirhodobacter populi]
MPRRFDFLDSLRGIAALAVVLFHQSDRLGLPGIPVGSYLAVDFFFILSGFVLTGAYDERLRQGQLGAKEFLVRRIIRLYPLFFAGMVFGFAVKFAKVFVEPGVEVWTIIDSFLLNLLLVPTPGVDGDPNLFPANGVAWSLFYEFIANAVFVLVAPRLSTRLLAGLVAVGALNLVACSLWYGGLDVGANGGELWGGSSRTAFGFCTGVLLWRIRGQLSHPGALGLAGVLSAVLVLTFVLPEPGQTRSWDALIVILVYPPLILAGAQVALRGRLHALCLWLGALSFPLYILHLPLCRLVARLASRLDVGAQGLGVVAMISAGTVASVLLARFAVPVDARMRMAITRWYQKIIARRAVNR